MKIATVQLDIVWENTQQNLTHLDQLFTYLEDDVDLIVLPEMFNTGFSMNPQQIATVSGGDALVWMKQLAQKNQAAVVGSIATEVEGDYYNRLYWVFPDGKYQTYDKRHLFRMANEHEAYRNGECKIIVEWKGVRFCPLICYDLRFPVWSRRTVEEDYDCLIYVANWPAARSDAWFSLLKARAIENLSFTIGVNRVGEDGNKITYDGKSVVFDFVGKQLDHHQDNIEGVSIQTIDLEALKQFREKFPAHLDADDFELKN